MIKVKMKELVAKEEILKSIFPEKMNSRASYIVSKKLKLINDEIAKYHEEKNKQIVIHGTLDENGNHTVEKEKLKEFVASVEPLLDMEIELNFDPISIVELEKYEMDAVKMAELHWLFVD